LQPIQELAIVRAKLAMVLVLTAALFTIVWEKSAAALNHPQSDAAVFVVRIGEATIDNKNAVTRTDCILVMPDGRFHLERRKQASTKSHFEPQHLRNLHSIRRISNSFTIF